MQRSHKKKIDQHEEIVRRSHKLNTEAGRKAWETKGKLRAPRRFRPVWGAPGKGKGARSRTMPASGASDAAMRVIEAGPEHQKAEG